MGIKDKQNASTPNNHTTQQPEQSENEEMSNQTITINAISGLSISERIHSDRTEHHQHHTFNYQFLKNKPIKKYRKREMERKDKIALTIQELTKRIEQLERELKQTNRKQDLCPHCHFYTTTPSIKDIQRKNTNDQMADTYQRTTSRQSLQFQKMDFNLPMMNNPEMQEKTWIFLGTIMIAMGSKVLGIDGTVNVFKIVKESVDMMRRQVQKSQEKLSMDFFLRKEEFQSQSRAQQIGFDPFYSNQQVSGGFELQGVRVESVQQYDLIFDQKVRFNVNYQALITVMEYMKQKSSICYN